MQAALHGKPMVVVYRDVATRVPHLAGAVKVNTFAMVNLDRGAPGYPNSFRTRLQQTQQPLKCCRLTDHRARSRTRAAMVSVVNNSAVWRQPARRRSHTSNHRVLCDAQSDGLAALCLLALRAEATVLNLADLSELARDAQVIARARSSLSTRGGRTTAGQSRPSSRWRLERPLEGELSRHGAVQGSRWLAPDACATSSAGAPRLPWGSG